MILIADSGSTKTDWRLIDGKGESHHFHTIGFNPFFQDTPTIYEELRQNLLPALSKVIDGNYQSLRVYFYGAGCSSENKCSIVKMALSQLFPGAFIEVDHDLLAAARALCGRSEGIVAILGTGSNTCHYNGENIVRNVSSLGYILGDEGSGAYIGKHFIQDYLNHDAPDHIRAKFLEKYNLSDEEILDSVYRKPMPSRFLASFSRFISEHKNDPYISGLINKSFSDFLDQHICKYETHRDLKLNVVGSVAYFYSDRLRDAAAARGINIGRILESPIEDLSKFHVQEQISAKNSI
jgi:N-acetylglucosamine kinase-like BadF-type ATPase